VVPNSPGLRRSSNSPFRWESAIPTRRHCSMAVERILAFALSRAIYSFFFIQSFQCWTLCAMLLPSATAKKCSLHPRAPAPNFYCHFLSCTSVQAA
jgi:hypothetical protein